MAVFVSRNESSDRLLVADAVLARMGLLLIGQISERDLTPTEVAPEI